MRSPASVLTPAANSLTACSQVAAFADGRAAVHEYDCLLLEFVLGQRPDDAHVSSPRACCHLRPAGAAWLLEGRLHPHLLCIKPLGNR